MDAFPRNCLIVVGLCGALIAIEKIMPKDNTDGPEGRSGLVISTDHLTGCQYLSLPLRSITPRLDETGKPICGKSAAPKGEPKP